MGFEALVGRAEESYSGRRAEFSQLVWDQVLHGVYLTESSVEKIQDPRVGGDPTQREPYHLRVNCGRVAGVSQGTPWDTRGSE